MNESLILNDIKTHTKNEWSLRRISQATLWISTGMGEPPQKKAGVIARRWEKDVLSPEERDV